MLATDVSPGQLQMLSQEVCEIEPWQDMRIDALAVDIKRD
jgi:hypothetical protein